MSALCAFKDNPLIPYLICSLCESIMKNPTRLHRCGHTFCQSCIPPSTNFCPKCNQKFEVKQPDLTAINLISDLEVQCNNDDCPYQGNYEDFINKHKDNCPMKEKGGFQTWKKGMQDFMDKNKFSKQIDLSAQKKEETVLKQHDQSSIVVEQVKSQQQINTIIDVENSNFQLPKIQNSEEKFIECIQVNQQQPSKKSKVIQI